MGLTLGLLRFILIYQCSRGYRLDDYVLTASVLNLSADRYLN
jgi:hypothetical protein